MVMHKIYSHLLTRPIRLDVIGVGGSGSQVISGLARLHRAMLALGHPGGLEVAAYDPDQVSKANVGRQLFYDADVGQFKTEVLIHRVNQCWGTSWKAYPARLKPSYGWSSDVLIGCVDSAASRREIHEVCSRNRVGYWLDLGNRAAEGQCILGEPKLTNGRDSFMRLPTVVELFPELLNKQLPEDDTPSCSLAEALERQELFVNQAVSTAALQMLWQLLRYGELGYHAVFIDLQHGRSTTLPVDRDAWKRFGFRGARKPPIKKAA